MKNWDTRISELDLYIYYFDRCVQSKFVCAGDELLLWYFYLSNGAEGGLGKN